VRINDPRMQVTVVSTIKSSVTQVCHNIYDLAYLDYRDWQLLVWLICWLFQVDEVDNQTDTRSFILSSDHIDSTDLQHVDPDTRDRLQALLEAAGKLLGNVEFGKMRTIRLFNTITFKQVAPVFHPSRTITFLQRRTTRKCSLLSRKIHLIFHQ